MSLGFVIIKKGEIVDANNVLKTLFISFDNFTIWGWQNVKTLYVKINVNKFLVERSHFYANHSRYAQTNLQLDKWSKKWICVSKFTFLMWQNIFFFQKYTLQVIFE